jgi:2,4-dienoyl-CoA reductase (NADPH2)
MFERSDRLGGQVAHTAGVPFQEAHRFLIDWRADELRRLDVSIELGTDVAADDVRSLEPDIVFVATGSAPDGRYDDAVSAVAVLDGVAVPAGPVIVIDEEGHRKASGTAELLASRGHEVTLVGDGIAPAALLQHSLAARPTLARLRAAGVRLVSDSRIVAVEPGRVRIETVAGVEQLVAATIVHAGRHRSVDSLVDALRGVGLVATAIGDAWAPRLVEDAIRSGYDAAEKLGAPAPQPDTIAT